MQEPLRHTAHGAMVPLPHGWQQSEVCVHTDAPSVMHVGATQTPITSGLAC